jgi:hypothetical protein
MTSSKTPPLALSIYTIATTTMMLSSCGGGDPPPTPISTEQPPQSLQRTSSAQVTAASADNPPPTQVAPGDLISGTTTLHQSRGSNNGVSFSNRDPIALCQSLRTQAKLAAEINGETMSDRDLDDRVCTYGRFGNLHFSQDELALYYGVSKMADHSVRWAAFIYKDSYDKEQIYLWINSSGAGFMQDNQNIGSTSTGTANSFSTLNIRWGFGPITKFDNYYDSDKIKSCVESNSCPSWLTNSLRLTQQNNATAMFPQSSQNATITTLDTSGFSVGISAGVTTTGPYFQFKGGYSETHQINLTGTPRILKHVLKSNTPLAGEIDYGIDWGLFKKQNAANTNYTLRSSLQDPISPKLDLMYVSGGGGTGGIDSPLRGRSYPFFVTAYYREYDANGSYRGESRPIKLTGLVDNIYFPRGSAEKMPYRPLCRQRSDSRSGTPGDIYQYFNPYAPDEFKMKSFILQTENSYDDLPIDSTSNNSWQFVKATTMLKALLNEPGNPESDLGCRPYYNKPQD